MKNRHDKIFDILEKVAEANEPACNNYRLAACLVYKNDIVSMGWNQSKTHPFQKRYAKNNEAIFIHAEISAISRALSNHFHPDFIRKCSMYVLRLRYRGHKDKTNVRALAKPCVGCSRCLASFGISKVYFTTDAGYDCL